jgi:VWFA-related protein
VPTPTRLSSRRGLGAAALLLAGSLVAAGPHQPAPVSSQAPATQPPTRSSQPTPPFKAGTNFVRVDVYPTHDGLPVDDLTAADFQVSEDGVLQKIESFEHIEVSAAPEGERIDPPSAARAIQLAADPHRRVFVIFLDTGGVGVAGSHDIKEPLIQLLSNILGPDDLVGLMTPQMRVDAITFGRKTQVIEQGLRDNWAWGRRDSIALDQEERLYEQCFPPTAGDPAGPDGLSDRARQLILRYRERVAFDSLRDLIQHMAAIREGRTAVIAVSEGWILFRPDQTLTNLRRDPTTGRLTEPVPGTPPPIGVGPGGVLTANPQPHAYDQNRQECERSQMELAMTDNDRYFRDLLEDANRANVSFYPIDPRGLPAVDTSIGPMPPLPPALDRAVLQHRIETLQILAENTDGIALVNNNDLTKQMRRLAADLTSYYLLGYSSTNTKLDGRLRSIKVKVTRPGVDVRARHGYRAATAAEVAAATKSAEAPKPAVNAALNAELGALVREGRSLETKPQRASREDAPGEPIVFRRGPITGNVLQRFTGREFSRTERLHIEMLPGQATAWTGALLDRTGKALPVPVTTGERTDATGQRWLTADLILAPLGAGDYAIELTVRSGAEPVKILKAIRVTQ